MKSGAHPKTSSSASPVSASHDDRSASFGNESLTLNVVQKTLFDACQLGGRIAGQAESLLDVFCPRELCLASLHLLDDPLRSLFSCFSLSQRFEVLFFSILPISRAEASLQAFVERASAEVECSIPLFGSPGRAADRTEYELDIVSNLANVSSSRFTSCSLYAASQACVGPSACHPSL